MKFTLTGVVAMDDDRAIGYQGALPWRLVEDLRLFKRITMGHPILMGRITHESMGRLLPGRQNIVLTRSSSYCAAEGAVVIHSLAQLEHVKLQDPEVMVIGGAQIYGMLLSKLDKLHVSHIHGTHEADTFFPPFSEQFPHVSEGEEYEGFTFRTYSR